MDSGQNFSFTVRMPDFSFPKEVKVCLAVVLACHLLLIGWIGLNGYEQKPDTTPPMTGMLLSGDSGTGAGASKAGGSTKAPKQENKNDTLAREKNGTSSRVKPDSGTEPVKDPVRFHEKNTSAFAFSTPADSSQARAATASGSGNGTGQGAGNGENETDGSGKRGNGFSGPYADAGFFSNPKPPYPAVSRRMGEEGHVLLSVHIRADGHVDEVKLKQSSGFTRLDDSAMKTVRHWRYVPAKRNGKPIPYWYVQPIRFSLDD